ncbi:MAG: adenylate kinase family enzyme [Paraglaciecola sp.]|jgi:adenylate kinase family enzyme
MPHNAMIDKEIRLVILGNSGSGKSTLAGQLAKRFNIAHLDLDTLAWLPIGSPMEALQRAPLGGSMAGINAFIHTQKNWLIEGCYSDLLEQVLPSLVSWYLWTCPSQGALKTPEFGPGNLINMPHLRRKTRS